MKYKGKDIYQHLVDYYCKQAESRAGARLNNYECPDHMIKGYKAMYVKASTDSELIPEVFLPTIVEVGIPKGSIIYSDQTKKAGQIQHDGTYFQGKRRASCYKIKKVYNPTKLLIAKRIGYEWFGTIPIKTKDSIAADYYWLLRAHVCIRVYDYYNSSESEGSIYVIDPSFHAVNDGLSLYAKVLTIDNTRVYSMYEVGNCYHDSFIKNHGRVPENVFENLNYYEIKKTYKHPDYDINPEICGRGYHFFNTINETVDYCR